MSGTRRRMLGKARENGAFHEPRRGLVQKTDEDHPRYWQPPPYCSRHNGRNGLPLDTVVEDEDDNPHLASYRLLFIKDSSIVLCHKMACTVNEPSRG